MHLSEIDIARTIDNARKLAGRMMPWMAWVDEVLTDRDVANHVVGASKGATCNPPSPPLHVLSRPIHWLIDSHPVSSPRCQMCCGVQDSRALVVGFVGGGTDKVGVIPLVGESSGHLSAG